MSDTWAPELTSRIAAEIKALRGERSGQWLSDETAAIGHRVSRSTISEIETGKRQTISIDAVIVLAAALKVSVADLLYPGLDDVEMLPDRVVRRGQAIEALVGTVERLQRLQAEVDRSAAAIRDELANIRKLSGAVDELRAQAQTGDVKVITESALADLTKRATAGQELAEIVDEIDEYNYGG
jgi:transcriptional regulator with XRE-family HTH domain